MFFDECLFIHDSIDTLYGVEPMPFDELPRVCTCGAPLTYADDLVFVSEPVQVFHPPGIVDMAVLWDPARPCKSRRSPDE